MLKSYSILILLIFLILFLIKKNSKPFIWIYYEGTRYSYTNLCLKTIQKYCKTDFNIKLINEKSISRYLPNIRKDLHSKLNSPQKADYYKFYLLFKYGGIWLSPNIIIFKNLKSFHEKLNYYDFVSSQCYKDKCYQLGDSFPSNEIIGSRKSTLLMKNCITDCDKILNSNEMNKYFTFKKHILWNNIQKLIFDDSLNYYHFKSMSAERDSSNRIYTIDRLISYENIDKQCVNKLLYINLKNTTSDFPEWFKSRSESYILKDDLLISKFFNFSLQN